MEACTFLLGSRSPASIVDGQRRRRRAAVVTTSRSPRELSSENRVATLYPTAAAAAATLADSNDFHICAHRRRRRRRLPKPDDGDGVFLSPASRRAPPPGDGASDATAYIHADRAERTRVESPHFASPPPPHRPDPRNCPFTPRPRLTWTSGSTPWRRRRRNIFERPRAHRRALTPG